MRVMVYAYDACTEGVSSNQQKNKKSHMICRCNVTQYSLPMSMLSCHYRHWWMQATRILNDTDEEACCCHLLAHDSGHAWLLPSLGGMAGMQAAFMAAISPERVFSLLNGSWTLLRRALNAGNLLVSGIAGGATSASTHSLALYQLHVRVYCPFLRKALRMPAIRTTFLMSRTADCMPKYAGRLCNDGKLSICNQLHAWQLTGAVKKVNCVL